MRSIVHTLLQIFCVLACALTSLQLSAVAHAVTNDSPHNTGTSNGPIDKTSAAPSNTGIAITGKIASEATFHIGSMSGSIIHPRWRGFNLGSLAAPSSIPAPSSAALLQTDFQMMQAFGFNFVRIPVSFQIWNLYRNLSAYSTVAQLNAAYSGDSNSQTALGYIDNAISWGQQYGIHVQICMYLAPGYSVISPSASKTLFNAGDPTQGQFALQWGFLASRYASLPASALSFDLLNEPPDMSGATYYGVMRGAIDQIRAVSTNRMILAEGLGFSTKPVPELVPLHIMQESHSGYYPMQISNYGTPGNSYSFPSWPLPIADQPSVADWSLINNGKGYIDQSSLVSFGITPWLSIGTGVMMGEWGANCSVPHTVALAWMQDWLIAMQQYDMGWALWNFRGPWGPIDNGRSDATQTSYTDTAGVVHNIDQAMLTLLQSY